MEAALRAAKAADHSIEVQTAESRVRSLQGSLTRKEDTIRELRERMDQACRYSTPPPPPPAPSPTHPHLSWSSPTMPSPSCSCHLPFGPLQTLPSFLPFTPPVQCLPPVSCTSSSQNIINDFYELSEYKHCAGTCLWEFCTTSFSTCHNPIPAQAPAQATGMKPAACTARHSTATGCWQCKSHVSTHQLQHLHSPQLFFVRHQGLGSRV